MLIFISVLVSILTSVSIYADYGGVSTGAKMAFPIQKEILNKKVTHFPKERNFVVWEHQHDLNIM